MEKRWRISVRDTLDLEAFYQAFLIADGLDVIAQAPAFAGQLVLIDLAAVADGLEDVMGLQGQPALPIPGSIGHDEVGVQLRIELARGIVAKSCRTDVPRRLPALAVSLSRLDCSKSLQLAQSKAAGSIMSFVKPLVAERHGHDGDGFLGRALKVVKPDGVPNVAGSELARAIGMLVEPQ